MPLPIAVLPAADADIDESFYYLQEQHSLETAWRFIDGVQASFARIQQMPLIGKQRNEITALRQWPIKGFEDYLIFYRILDTAIEVVRILHARRDLETIIDDAS